LLSLAVGRIKDVEYGHAENCISMCFINTNKYPLS